jgi:hypothetical protein
MEFNEEDKSFDSQPSTNPLEESTNSTSEQGMELAPSPLIKLTPEEHQKFSDFKEILNKKGINNLKDDFIIRYLIATKYLLFLILDITLRILLNLLYGY